MRDYCVTPVRLDFTDRERRTVENFKKKKKTKKIQTVDFIRVKIGNSSACRKISTGFMVRAYAVRVEGYGGRTEGANGFRGQRNFRHVLAVLIYKGFAGARPLQVYKAEHDVHG